MEKRVINESEQNATLYFYWTKVSPRLKKVWTGEEQQLYEWCHENYSNRVLTDGNQWEQVVLAIGERVAELNRGRIGFGPYLHLDAMAPTDLSMGYIHISRVDARHKCIHLSVGRCLGYVRATSQAAGRDRLS